MRIRLPQSMHPVNAALRLPVRTLSGRCWRDRGNYSTNQAAHPDRIAARNAQRRWQKPTPSQFNGYKNLADNVAV